MATEFPIFPKHVAPRKRKQPQPATPAPVAPTTATLDMPDVSMGLSGIEEVLGKIAHSVKSYHANACDGNIALELFTSPSGYPMRLSLESEAIERIATAFERIADAVAKLADIE
jgi:hypothetical protein